MARMKVFRIPQESEQLQLYFLYPANPVLLQI
jgi:hypothetical protein